MSEDPRPDAESDEVDRIIAGWAAARPGLDVAPMAVLSRIHRLSRHLDVARRASFTEAGLEAWEFDVLSALRRSPEAALSPGALMRSSLVTSGTMTTRIDKLARRGLVSRQKDPRDGRGVRVRLEEEGARAVDSAIEQLLRAEQALLSPLPGQDAEVLADLLRRLLLQFETPPPDGA